MALTVSRDGTLFVACREAIVLTAYPDGPHHSIGCGHNDPALRAGDKITVRAALALLRKDLAERAAHLDKVLKVPVSQRQIDALASFYYQNGNKKDGQDRPGFTHMMGLVNAGSFNAAADYFLECDRNSAGEAKAGLAKRRGLERTVFLRGVYGLLDPIPYWPGDPIGPPQQYHLQPGDLDA